jgi:hypothetical protein
MEKIVAVLSYPEKMPPLRAYLFSSAIDRKQPSGSHEFKSLCTVTNQQLLSIIYNGPMQEAAKRFNYIIAFLWKQDASSNINLFGYHGIKNWRGNPDMRSWVFENGVYRNNRDVVCETGAIILGKEGQHRRSTRNLAEYIGNTPKLYDLVPREVSPEMANISIFGRN